MPPPSFHAPVFEPAGAADVQDFTIVVCFEDERRERFLMARHRERGWELPGGRVEPHENPLEGAVREFGEEIGHTLKKSELVLRQPREHGLCWVATGLFGSPVQGWHPDQEDKIVEWRFVRRLSDVEPLAFPDDPYEAMEVALGAKLR